ncbi:MAG: hypothetical protein ABJ314_18310 [Ilumatobacter sp.]|uniref:hypothetical protein n=1 Tax=Ilumatobacter sp. TaxID=1967498 RepID=UPI0032984BEE
MPCSTSDDDPLRDVGARLLRSGDEVAEVVTDFGRREVCDLVPRQSEVASGQLPTPHQDQDQDQDQDQFGRPAIDVGERPLR